MIFNANSCKWTPVQYVILLMHRCFVSGFGLFFKLITNRGSKPKWICCWFSWLHLPYSYSPINFNCHCHSIHFWPIFGPSFTLYLLWIFTPNKFLRKLKRCLILNIHFCMFEQLHLNVHHESRNLSSLTFIMFASCTRYHAPLWQQSTMNQFRFFIKSLKKK